MPGAPALNADEKFRLSFQFSNDLTYVKNNHFGKYFRFLTHE
jgi:hypothetical protein